MSDIMKCFVMHGIGKVGLMNRPVRRPGPNDAIIRTTAALICTSDTHTVGGAIGDRPGLTLGHEAVGAIHDLGEVAAASGLFKIGQRVAVSAITTGDSTNRYNQRHHVARSLRPTQAEESQRHEAADQLSRHWNRRVGRRPGGDKQVA